MISKKKHNFLTDRENKMLELAKQGKSEKQIAGIMKVLPQTVYKTFDRIAIKLVQSQNTVNKLIKYRSMWGTILPERLNTRRAKKLLGIKEEDEEE